MTPIGGSVVDRRSWRWALVATRTFVGVVYLANGLSKLFDFHTIHIGPWKSYLIDRNAAHDILRSLVRDPNQGIGVARDVANNFVLPNWGVFQWLVTFGEIGVGVGLIFGVLPRLAALGGAAMAWPLFVWSLGGGTWTFDYLFEPVLLTTLAFVPVLPGLGGYVPLGNRRLRATPARPSTSAAAELPRAHGSGQDSRQ